MFTKVFISFVVAAIAVSFAQATALAPASDGFDCCYSPVQFAIPNVGPKNFNLNETTSGKAAGGLICMCGWKFTH